MSPHSPTQKADRACPRCGLAFSSERLDGLCPACLLSNALDTEVHDDGPAFWEDLPEKKAKTPARTFSHFELLDELGRGGMGVVYRARDLNTERIVALKVLQAHHLDAPDLVQRFRSEVRAVSSLDHPYVLPIHEVGEHEGIPFFSMKLTTGGSLAHSIGTYLGKPKEAAQLLAKVARGVQHAHERGILHRDLKPGNILIDAAGEPYVCDFGLAKWIEDDQKLTVTAAVLGTPHYIAPEQALGSKALTIAVDIYSLGAILYELLTGRPPFVGSTVLETLVASQEKTPDRPSSLAKTVPADLETICLKALEHNPSQRYVTAGAFANDLENYIAGRPITARPVNAAEQLWRWAKRNPLPALLVVALITTLVFIAIGQTISAARIDEQRKRAVKAEHDAKQELYQARVSQARAALVGGRTGQREEALDALRQAAQLNPSLEVRNDVISALSLIDLKLDRLWKIRDGSRVQPIFDDSLSNVLAESSPGKVTLTRIADNKTEAQFVGPADAGTVEAIAQWKFQLVAIRYSGGKIVVWRIPETRPIFSCSYAAQKAQLPWLDYDFSFSRDGESLYTPSESGFDVTDVQSGLKTHEVKLGAQPNCISFSPSGTQFAASFTSEKEIVVCSHTNHRIERTIALPSPAWHLAWSPDDVFVAVACRDFNIYVYNTNTGSLQCQFLGHRQEVTHVCFSHSGDLLASTSRDNTLRIWSLKSRSQEVMAPGYGGTAPLYFSLDDKFLAAGTGDTRACIFALSGQDRICTTIAPQSPVQRAMLVSSVGYSPRGTSAFSVSYEGVEIFDTFTHSRMAYFALDNNKYKAARYVGESALLVASEESGIRIYDTARENLGGALKPVSVVTQGNDYTIGSVAEPVRDTKVSLINRKTGRVDLLDWRTGNSEFITDSKKGVKDALYCPTAGLIFITYFEGNSASGNDTDVWSLAQHRCIATIPSGRGSLVQISPNGKWLATASIDGCKVWDVGTWRLLKHFPSFGSTLCFSPDSAILAVSENEAVFLINTHSFEVIAELHPPVFSSVTHRLAFSPDGSELIAQGADGTIRFWSIKEMDRHLRELNLSWNFTHRM